MSKHEKLKTLSPWIIISAFIIGLLTAIALRVLIILVHVSPEWVRPVWYFAVVGNFFFFWYRYYITRKRKLAIKEHNLIEKLTANSCLEDEDRDVTIYLLNSIEKSLENYNYLIIFIFSILAIAIDLIMTSL